MDVIVGLDSSGSIGGENYKKEKIFAYDLARVFANRPTNRFGLTIFSSTVKTIVELANNWTQDQVNSEILNAVYMGYQTYTNLAIDSAVNQFEASVRGAVQKLVVITDGVSNDPAATIASAQAAAGAGIETFAVGIGSGISYAELLAIAGGDSSRVFTVDDFDGLTAELSSVSSAVCN